MALTVLKPGGAIHPVVGSIYSAAKPGVSPETLGDEEIVPARDGRQSLRESVSADATSSPPEVRPRGGANAIEVDRPASLIATRLSAAGSAPPASGGIGTESAIASLKATDEVDRRVESSEGVTENEAASAMRPYSPLITAAFAPSPPVAAIGPSRMSNAGSSQSLAQRSRTTDEIEIHIGRIEIAAVHPTPARTAPAKPPRRAASLDEYLKRRDGRPS